MAGGNLGNLFFRLNADTKGLETANKEVKRFSKNTERNVNRASKAFSMLGKAIAAIAVVVAAKRVLLLADTFNVLQQRIRAATKATGSYAKVSKQLMLISTQTGSALETNVGLFQALARASNELGATTDEMLSLTRAVNQLGVISGATGEAMKFGLRQFTQGLSAGIFRAEEFNSILENVPEIAARIGEAMGLTVGELRQAVINGEVLSEDVFRALLSQSEKINKEFKEMPESLGRTGATFKTVATQVVSEFLTATGVIGQINKGLELTIELMQKINAQKIGSRLKTEAKSFFDIIRVGGLFAKKDLGEILKAREDAIKTLSTKNSKATQQKEIDDAKKKEDALIEVQKKAKAEREKRQSLEAFFQVDLKKRSSSANAAQDAKSFRDQISMASKHSKEFFALNKAMALATAAIEAPSAILSAYSFGTKFGGPFVGTTFAAIAAAATGVQIGAIASASFGGGRQTGGPVTPNGLFRVNESGPEVVSIGNKDFLMTGNQSGTVTANKNNGGGGATVVNLTILNNGEPIQAQSSQQETDNGFDLELILDRADERVANGIRNGDGATNGAIGSVFNLNRTAGALN